MSTCQSEMKVPIRPAPPPPVNPKHSHKPGPVRNNPVTDIWNKSAATVQKKKPPPRPPPPKFTNSNKKSAPSRPGQLLADLFHRKNNANAKANETQSNKPSSREGTDSKGNNVFMLIDFNSPPSSPTLTTRSSSDALSVNSFGSDGVTQCSNSSGNASNVESGFEDDFDLFSGASKKLENLQPRDPWSPPPRPPESKTCSNGKNNPWVAFPSPGSSKKIPLSLNSMPTIIRSKPEGQKPPQKANCDMGSSVDLLSDIFQTSQVNNSHLKLSNSIFEEDDNEDWASESPPMPTCPPPAPPPEILNGLLQDLDNLGIKEPKPHGVALYDYQGEQPDDLSFKKDDVINLVRKIDENWYVGESGGREGSVPANFISVKVPLPGENEYGEEYVTALYPFRPETWDDLEFESGATIRVTHRINQDWLYGEYNGKSGQFPANFVNRIPNDLPMMRID